MIQPTKNHLLSFCLGLLIGGNVAFAATDNDTQVTAAHDPTQPTTGGYTNYDGQEDNIYGIKIDGILFSKTRKIVTINGQHLQVGDKIGQIIIVDIYQDAIKVKDSTVATGKPSELMIKMADANVKSLNTTTSQKSKGRF